MRQILIIFTSLVLIGSLLLAGTGISADTGDGPDLDGDQVADDADCAPADATKYRNLAYVDLDGDGIGDNGELVVTECFGEEPSEGYTLFWYDNDNCVGVYNPDQSDIDHDGLGDLCDDDTDGDGIENINDCAAIDATRWRNLAYPDDDLDNFADSLHAEPIECFGQVPPAGYVIATAVDNCPGVANLDQADLNQNGVGDICEDSSVIIEIPEDEERLGFRESGEAFQFKETKPIIDLFSYRKGIEFRCELDTADRYKLVVRKNKKGVIKKRRNSHGVLRLRKLGRGSYQIRCVGKLRTKNGVIRSKMSREKVKVLKDKTIRIF